VKKKLLCLSLVILFGFATSICLAKYSGGDGSPATPYRISNANDMNDIGLHDEDWGSHFVMVNDVNLAQFTGTEFNIIGPNSLAPFTGTFDGNGHTISNFTYNSPGTYAGIFGSVGSPFDPNGEIKNLGLIDPNVDAGTGVFVGSLVGHLSSGTVSNCYAEGTSVTGASGVGGLVGGGNYTGTISNCYATGDVSGNNYVGGLVGSNGDTILDCYATASVSGNQFVGGLVGMNKGTISNCYADVNVSSTGPDTGGLVGKNLFGTILDCNAIGNVSGSADKTGGLVGYNDRGTIANCFTTGNVDGTLCVGGLIGEDASDSEISNCYTTGNISGTGDYIGGLRGKGSSEISECYTTGSVSGGNYVGGLAGGGDTYMASISNCYSTGDVNGNDYTGGLMGFCGSVRNSYATGSVNGNDYTGGLVGYHQGRGTGPIANCYATGNVNGNYQTGGLVGSGSYVSNCYATGDVNGNNCAGGLAGRNYWGMVSNSYATGAVDGNDYTGGLVGYHQGGSYTKCFWDRDVNPDVNGIGNLTDPNVIGKSTAEMQTESTFTNAGWDFVGETINGPNDIWTIHDGNDYPVHVWPLVNFVGWYEVDLADYAFFSNYWKYTNCGDVNDCNGVDLDFSDTVDGKDLKIICDHWLTGLQ